MIALWRKDNPNRDPALGEEFVDLKLFERDPGNRAYPFKHKSRVSFGVTYINPVYGKAILHAADQVAGGGAKTAGLGGARENSSIRRSGAGASAP